jgi:hypothetical protein
LQHFGGLLLTSNPFVENLNCFSFKLNYTYIKNKQTFYSFSFISKNECTNNLKGDVLINFSSFSLLSINYIFEPKGSYLESLSDQYKIDNLNINYQMDFQENEGLCKLIHFDIKYDIVKLNKSWPVQTSGQIQFYLADEKKKFRKFPTIEKWSKLSDFQLMCEIEMLNEDLPFISQNMFSFFEKNFKKLDQKLESDFKNINFKVELDSADKLPSFQLMDYSKGNFLYEPQNGFFGTQFFFQDSLFAEYVFSVEINFLPFYKVRLTPHVYSKFNSIISSKNADPLFLCVSKNVLSEINKLEVKINHHSMRNYDQVRSVFETYIGQYIKSFNGNETISIGCH